MNHKMKVIAILIYGCFVTGCRDSSGHDDLREALRVHREAVDIAQSLRVFLNRDTIDYADSVLLWKKVIDDWEQNLVEVPGNHTEHHSHHNHHHVLIELAPREMLAVQRAMKEQIEQLRKRIMHGSEH